MNTFFDLKEFLVTILKKAKFCIVLSMLCVLGGIFIRLIPLTIEYITYQEPTIESNQKTIADFPYKYQARRTLFIKPQYKNIDGILVDETSTYINAYLACYQNKEILQPLVEKYYTEAANDFLQLNEKLVQYNYNTKSILEEIFTLNNFYEIVTIKSVGNTSTESGNYINIYATTGDNDLSERIVTDAENLISAYVRELVGEYSYTVTEGQIGQLTPQAVSGLIPKTLSSEKSAVAMRPEFPDIIKRSIKGGIWGLAGGLGISVLLCFFIHCIDLNIATENDLKRYSVPLLAAIKLKEKRIFLGFINQWIDLLEGNYQNCLSYEAAGELACAYIRTIEKAPTGNIVVTGAGIVEELERFAEVLKKAMPEYSFIVADVITTSAETVKSVSNSLGVILFESVGHSGIDAIEKEIFHIKQLKKTIYGIILEK